MMNILVTGDYGADYNRIKILLSGLKKRSDINLVEFPIKKTKEFKSADFKEALQKCDLIFLPSFTHKFVRPLRKRTQKPIIFDPLVSRYLTKVFDYKQVSKYSPRALKNYLKDYFALKNCDLILADTHEHKKYFQKTFNIDTPIKVLPVGVEIAEFNGSLKERATDKVEVGFYGGFIPLQGALQIVETAKLMHDRHNVHFTLIGTGFEWEKAKKQANKYNLTNIDFPGWGEATDLPQKIANFDICLGIFGDTPKADIVIPNKIYHYAAMQKPIITKNTAAIKEIFTHNENILLCNNTPDAIKESIEALIAAPNLSDKIAQKAYQLVTEKYNEYEIAELFMSFLTKF